MMSMPEQGAKVATSLIDALKNSPGTLALIVINLIFIAVIYFGVKENRSEIQASQTAIIAQMSKQQESMHDLIETCLQRTQH